MESEVRNSAIDPVARMLLNSIFRGAKPSYRGAYRRGIEYEVAQANDHRIGRNIISYITNLLPLFFSEKKSSFPLFSR